MDTAPRANPLRTSPAFRRLWLARTVSHVGDGVALVALVLLVRRTEGTGAAVGERGALLVDAASFAVSGALLIGLPALRPERAGAPGGFLAVGREGLAYAWRTPVVRTFLIVLFLGVAFAAVDNVALVFLVRDTLGGGQLAFGVVAGAFAVLLALPMAGLALVLAVPSMDLTWEHQPSHFWLVLGVAVLNVVLGLLANEAARQREDPRLFLVSMALLASAGFLALHALATPGIVVHDRNAGFVIATPVGLLLAAAFAAASAVALEEPRAVRLRAWQAPLRLLLALLLVVWAVASLAQLPPLDHAPAEERVTWVLVLLPFGVLAYAFAAVRYLALWRRRRQLLPLAVAVAFVLLAEALIAVAFGRAWHTSWWEWHVLMAVAFGTILLTARNEYRRERSFTETFGGLYTEGTLERLERRQREALRRLTETLQEGGDVEATAARLRDGGFSS